MRVVGIDPSLTGLGLSVFSDVHGPRVDTYKPKLPKAPTWADRCSRIADLVRQVELMTATQPADLVAIEGPSYGSQKAQSGHHERGGLWWAIASAMTRREIPLAVVAPKSLKLYVTGSGSASKDDVVRDVARRFPDVQFAGNDAADAVVLGAMAWHRMVGGAWVFLPAAQTKAMDGVEWPELLSDDLADDDAQPAAVETMREGAT